jgi:hypothetical protein
LKGALRRINAGPRYYGAIFESWPNKWGVDGARMFLGRDKESVRHEMHADQALVFPQYVELVEGEEQVIPSTVRLQLFDDLKFDSREPLFSFSHVQWIDKVFDGRVNGKMAVRTRRFAVALGESRGKKIKATSDAIDDCSDMSVDGAWPTAINCELKELLAHFRVKLFDKQISWSIEPGYAFLFENWELGSGPIDGGIGV